MCPFGSGAQDKVALIASVQQSWSPAPSQCFRRYPSCILMCRGRAVQINKSFHQLCQKVDTEIWERDYP